MFKHTLLTLHNTHTVWGDICIPHHIFTCIRSTVTHHSHTTHHVHLVSHMHTHHARIHTRKSHQHTHTHYTHTHTQITHTCPHTLTQSHTHAHIHICTHTHAHTHAHTQTHTQPPPHMHTSQAPRWHKWAPLHCLGLPGLSIALHVWKGKLLLQIMNLKG